MVSLRPSTPPPCEVAQPCSDTWQLRHHKILRLKVPDAEFAFAWIIINSIQTAYRIHLTGDINHTFTEKLAVAFDFFVLRDLGVQTLSKTKKWLFSPRALDVYFLGGFSL